MFVKEGDNGTNGTGYYCRIIPNVADVNTIPNWAIYNITPSTNYLNYTVRDANKWFRALLYEGATCVFDGTESNDDYKVNWSLLRNKYTGSTKDNTWFDIADDGVVSYTATSASAPYATIFKVTITHNDKEYTATYPLMVVR